MTSTAHTRLPRHPGERPAGPGAGVAAPGPGPGSDPAAGGKPATPTRPDPAHHDPAHHEPRAAGHRVTATADHQPADRIDLVTAVHLHQLRRGPYLIRLLAAFTALIALNLAIWLPESVIGPRTGGFGLLATAAVAVAGVGVAVNAGVLYHLARGYPPPLPAPGRAQRRAASRQLWLWLLLPGALAVRGRRAVVAHRTPAGLDPDKPR